MTMPTSMYVRCAHCRGMAMHQNRVDVYCRVQDAVAGAHVVVDLAGGAGRWPEFGETGDPVVTVDRDASLEDNPSPRRHGLTISLYCESGKCPPTRLHVYQHKGITHVEVAS